MASMSMDNDSKNAVETIRSIYRIVLGASVSFLPFVLFFLVKDSKVDLLPAIILWLLTYWIIISELWNIEDITYNYPTSSNFRSLMSMIYLIVLTMIPVAIVLGLDKSNVLEKYMIIIVGEGKYNSIQPCVLVFAIAAAVDMALQYSYKKNEKDKIDQRFFEINMSFDFILVIIYGLILIFVLPTLSVVWGAITLFIVYFVEFLANWIVIPSWFPKEFEE